jgi:hypothetical protein
MSDQNGTTQESEKSTFDLSSCMEMMGEMFSQGGCDCGCGEMMSQAKFNGENPEEWQSMMGQMIEACFGGQVKDEGASEEVVNKS